MASSSSSCLASSSRAAAAAATGGAQEQQQKQQQQQRRRRRGGGSLYDQIYPKLREFQKEAVEFATEGKKYDRQFNNSISSGHQQAAAGPDSTSAAKSSDAHHHQRQKLQQQQYQNFNFAEKSLLGKGRILCADEMGLGKTPTSLAVMAYYEDEWPLLVVCPASLRYTWPAEIEKFFPSLPAASIYVVRGFQDVAWVKRLYNRNTNRDGDIRVVVLTYSLIQQRSAVAQQLFPTTKGKNTSDSDRPHFECMIVDESHNLRDKNSQRTQMLMPGLHRSRRLVLLSGTPALARPVELWPQVHAIAPKFFGNFTQYANRYCEPRRKQFGRGRYVWEFKGASHVAELHAKLSQVTIRRLKSDVLNELPPKQRSIVPIQIPTSRKQQCQRAIDDLEQARVDVEEVAAHEYCPDRAGTGAGRNPYTSNNSQARTMLTKAYQASGIGKAPAVADYLIDWLEGSSSSQSKILVFAHHKGVIDCLQEALLKKYGPNNHIRIDGEVPAGLRQKLVGKFQTCARVRVALLSMTAAGVGLTLTAASTVLFAELHWTPGVLAQAEDRAHRIGSQHASVQILYLVCRDASLSVDMKMWKMLGRKIGTIDQIVDGKKETPYLFTSRQTDPGAVSSSNSAASDDGKQRGRTTQEELTSFFAETDLNRTHSRDKKNKVPVKGTIESFFRKQQQASDISKKKTAAAVATSQLRSSTSSNIAGTLSQTETQGKAGNRESFLSTAVAALPAAAATTATAGCRAAEEAWSCYKCTFINARPGLVCEICGIENRKLNSPLNRTDGDASGEVEEKRKATATGQIRVTWSCYACTLSNSAEATSVGVYSCSLCNTPYSLTLERNDRDDAERVKDDGHPKAGAVSASQQPWPDSEDYDSEGDSLFTSTKSSVSATTRTTTGGSACAGSKSSSTKSNVEEPCSDGSDSDLDDLLKTPVFAKKASSSRRSGTCVTDSTCRKGKTASRSRGRASTASSRNICGQTRASVSSTSEVICLDGAHLWVNSESRSNNSEVIEIDSDDSVDEALSTSRKEPLSSEFVAHADDVPSTKKPPPNNTSTEIDPVTFKFSVSMNSGRITVHEGHAGVALGNFDLRDVVTTETADKILDARVKKASVRSLPILSVQFNDSSIKKLHSDLFFGDNNRNLALFQEEVKLFVSSFLRLSEMQKKVFKESGESSTASSLPRCVAKLWQSTCNGQERYTGGAKEQAQERRKQGLATENDLNVLGGLACAFCAKKLNEAQRLARATYCSEECAEEGRLRRGGMYSSAQIRSAVFARDVGVCALCGFNCHGLYEQIMALEPPLRFQKLLDADWKLPKSGRALQNFLQNPKEGDFWQADHILPVSEGGGGCGLDNLRTLCVPCHSKETEKLHRRLKLRTPQKKNEDGSAAISEDGRKRKQCTISDFLDGTNSSRKNKR